jgi:hypothetical protein
VDFQSDLTAKFEISSYRRDPMLEVMNYKPPHVRSANSAINALYYLNEIKVTAFYSKATATIKRTATFF